MTTLILSFVLIGLAIAGLSIGVLMGRKPLKGSCGGLAAFDGNGGCDLCGGNPEKCEDLNTGKG